MYLVCFSMNSVIIFFASMCQCSQVCVHLNGNLIVISVCLCSSQLAVNILKKDNAVCLPCDTVKLSQRFLC